MAAIYGHVGRVIHQGENYYVFAFDVQDSEPPINDKIVTVTGHLYGLQQVRIGVSVQLVGDWVRHPKYGRQFSMYGWYPWATHDYGVQRFLNECVLGFEDAQLVETITNAFGTLTYEKLTDAPKDVIDLFPEGSTHRMQVETALLYWNEARALSNLSVFLQDYDLAEEVVRNVFAKFGTEAINLISENPYQLVSVDGFEFSKADRLAARIGIARNDSSPLRWRALLDSEDAGAAGSPLCSSWGPRRSLSNPRRQRAPRRLQDGRYLCTASLFCRAVEQNRSCPCGPQRWRLLARVVPVRA
jgi:ATP-dependent exoDNAse (exonuclease V) alpha subunit